MKFQEPPKEIESKKEALDRVESKPKRETKKRKGAEFRPPRMVVLDKPVESVCIDEELNVPVRRSSRHHQPPLPFWENSYMIYNERLGRSEVVIGPNSHVEMVDGHPAKQEQQPKIEVEDEEEEEDEDEMEDEESEDSENEDETDSMIEPKPKAKAKAKEKAKPSNRTSKSKSRLPTNTNSIQNGNTVLKPTSKSKSKAKSKTVSKPKSQNPRKSATTVPKVPPKELHVHTYSFLSNLVESRRH